MLLRALDTISTPAVCTKQRVGMADGEQSGRLGRAFAEAGSGRLFAERERPIHFGEFAVTPTVPRRFRGGRETSKQTL